ncbi:hypothetical protein RYX36_013359, partial [Vicia faba]
GLVFFSEALVKGTLRLESNKNGGSEREIEPKELVPSDNKSVTSGSSSRARDNGGKQMHGGSRVVLARFLLQTDLSSSRNGGIGNKAMDPPKLLVSKKSLLASPASSPRGIVNSRLQYSPIRFVVRPISPSQLASPSPWSPSRGVIPSRGRNGIASSLTSIFVNEPYVLSFFVDVPRGETMENKVADAHLLRLIHNRLMQW